MITETYSKAATCSDFNLHTISKNSKSHLRLKERTPCKTAIKSPPLHILLAHALSERYTV
jgi:hypothetical protein